MLDFDRLDLDQEKKRRTRSPRSAANDLAGTTAPTQMLDLDPRRDEAATPERMTAPTRLAYLQRHMRTTSPTPAPTPPP